MGLISPGGAGGADNVAIADGSDVNAGATTDAANTTGTTGTLSGKLRGIVALLAAGLPASLGQKAMAASAPVVVASDQSAIPTTPAGTVASGATDSGNPLKIGAVFNSTPPTLTNGQRGDAQMDSRANIRTMEVGASSGGIDGQSNTIAGMVAPGGVAALLQINGPYGFNGATWDRLRTPTTFKTATATASGDTAVWTPTSGKKFRLMSYAIYVTANAAQSVAGLIEILLRDATTAIGVGYSIFVPGAAGTTFVDSSDSGWVQLGNGFLSGAADRVLNVNLSAGLTAGEIRVVACGTEE